MIACMCMRACRGTYSGVWIISFQRDGWLCVVDSYVVLFISHLDVFTDFPLCSLARTYTVARHGSQHHPPLLPSSPLTPISTSTPWTRNSPTLTPKPLWFDQSSPPDRYPTCVVGHRVFWERCMVRTLGRADDEVYVYALVEVYVRRSGSFQLLDGCM